jgi:hypothetical protein
MLSVFYKTPACTFALKIEATCPPIISKVPHKFKRVAAQETAINFD